MPVVIALVAIIAMIGIANLSSLLRGNKKTAQASVLPMRPAAPNAQQVNSFETQQELLAKRDAEELATSAGVGRGDATASKHRRAFRGRRPQERRP